MPARLHARGGVLLLDPQNNNDHLIVIIIFIIDIWNMIFTVLLFSIFFLSK